MAAPVLPSLDSSEREALCTFLEARIAELRVQNDSHTLDDIQTATVRGRIAELRDFLGKLHPKQPAKSATRGSGNLY